MRFKKDVKDCRKLSSIDQIRSGLHFAVSHRFVVNLPIVTFSLSHVKNPQVGILFIPINANLYISHILDSALRFVCAGNIFNLHAQVHVSLFF